MLPEIKKIQPSVKELLERTDEQVEIYRQLYPIFNKELTDNNLQSLFKEIEIEMPLAPVLAKMENNGIHLDKETLAESSRQIGEEIASLEEQIYTLAGGQFNIGSPKQLGEVLFEKLHIIENAKLTKTKQYQTGEEILVKLAAKHPIVPLILEWRGLTKLKSTYIDALPQLVNPATGRIHTTFNQTVTATGRLSSTNPNLQNIPIRTARGKELRKAFTPTTEGSVILAADYSQVELRLMAHLSDDPSLIEAFRKGEDIHSATAAKLFHKTESRYVPAERAISKHRTARKRTRNTILFFMPSPLRVTGVKPL